MAYHFWVVHSELNPILFVEVGFSSILKRSQLPR
jgi:hypothetical protein